MTIYVSKNSEYEIREGDLIKNSNGNIQNLGSDFSYVSEETIIKILKDKKISLIQLNSLDTLVGESILDSFGSGIDMTKEGGRFFALIKRKKGYTSFYSGKILEIIKDKEYNKLEEDLKEIEKEITLVEEEKP